MKRGKIETVRISLNAVMLLFFFMVLFIIFTRSDYLIPYAFLLIIGIVLLTFCSCILNTHIGMKQLDEMETAEKR